MGVGVGVCCRTSGVRSRNKNRKCGRGVASARVASDMHLKLTCQSVFTIAALLVLQMTSLAAETAFATKPAAHWSVRSQPATIVNGAPVLFQVKAPTQLTALHGTWLGHDLSFSYDSTARTWYAFAGASLKTSAGAYPLLITGEKKKGGSVSYQQKIRVGRAKYRTVALTVGKQFTEPDKAQVEEIHKEETLKKDIFQQSSPDRQWAGRFLPPVEATVSDQFGTQRKFNGKTQSVHQGLDYHVSQGTPVDAVNAGTVTLARPLFFEGSCVVVDHGQGLMTLYLHLSEIRVKEGDHVKRGQELGLSGATGRATGAHLHVAARWQGVYLNPGTLFAIHFPGS
jgi:murein DD-endopeptidase MepM/ murein hydrolase activator NlpD